VLLNVMMDERDFDYVRNEGKRKGIIYALGLGVARRVAMTVRATGSFGPG